MTAKRKREETPVVEAMLDQIDFHGMTREELDGEDGLLRQIAKRFYEQGKQAEMDEHLG